ncbi:MAG: hypothetical protein WDO19_05305 [Bacteroidota bacterium]
MKNLSALLIALPFLAMMSATQAQTITLVKNGVANSVIILPGKPGVTEIQAAKVLQDYIERISGAGC